MSAAVVRPEGVLTPFESFRAMHCLQAGSCMQVNCRVGHQLAGTAVQLLLPPQESGWPRRRAAPLVWQYCTAPCTNIHCALVCTSPHSSEAATCLS